MLLKQSDKLNIRFYFCVRILTICFSEAQKFFTMPQTCLSGILLLRKGSWNG